MRAVFLAILVISILVACESRMPGPPVVVYATGEAGSELDLLLANFSSETDVPVAVVWGD